MVKLKKGRSEGGPSSSIGLMRFFDSESSGPTVSPQFIILVCFAVAVIWILMHRFFG